MEKHERIGLVAGSALALGGFLYFASNPSETQLKAVEDQNNAITAVASLGKEIQSKVLAVLPYYPEVKSWEKRIEIAILNARTVAEQHQKKSEEKWLPRLTLGGFLENEGAELLQQAKRAQTQIRIVEKAIENLTAAMENPAEFVEKIKAIQTIVNRLHQEVHDWMVQDHQKYDSPEYRQKYAGYIKSLPKFPDRAELYAPFIKLLDDLKKETDRLVENSKETLQTTDEVNAMTLVKNQTDAEANQKIATVQYGSAQDLHEKLNTEKLVRLMENIAKFWATVNCDGAYEYTETPFSCFDSEKDHHGNCKEIIRAGNYSFSIDSTKPFEWDVFQEIQKILQNHGTKVANGTQFFGGRLAFTNAYEPIHEKMNLSSSLWYIEDRTYSLECHLRRIREEYSQQIHRITIPPTWTKKTQNVRAEERKTDKNIFWRDREKVGQPVEHKAPGMIDSESRAWHQIPTNFEFPVKSEDPLEGKSTTKP